MTDVADPIVAAINATEQTPAERVLRSGRPVTIGGVQRRLRPLVVADSRRWRELVVTTLRKLLGQEVMSGSASWEMIAPLLVGSTDVMIDLLTAYDKDGNLGGRTWIEEHATDEEVYEALKVALGYAFPFVRDAAGIRSLAGEAVAQMLQASRNSGSPSGDERPTS